MIKEFNPGKFFVLGFKGQALDPEFIRFAQRNPPSGYLLLGENYENRRQLRSLVSSLREVSGNKAFVMVDQEPGRVQRFTGEFPVSRMPAEYVSQSASAEFRSWCRETAQIMAEDGLNANLAPVVDLWPVEKDFAVLNGRCFGNVPAVAAEFASILIEEFGKTGIMTCAKHFPGLGSARGDPHAVQSVSDEPLERFVGFHWQPFRVAIRAGADFVMTTHLLAPSLDSEHCTTYSESIVSRIRQDLGHRGLIISDDLFMRGADISGAEQSRACAAIAAGHDLVILSRDLEFQRKEIAEVENKYHSDERFRKIADESGARIDAMMNRGTSDHQTA